MNLKILMSGLFIVLFLGASSVNSASDGVELTVDFVEQYVAIQIDSEVTLPAVTNGYSTSNSISVSNVGTVDIVIESELYAMDYYLGLVGEEDNQYNEIFNLLELDMDGDYFSVYDFQYIMEKPTLVGGTRAQTLAFKLDLRNYSEVIETDDNQIAVVLTALPA